MLVVCSDIHVLGSPLMSEVVTRMQDLAYEFSTISGVIPPDPLSESGPHLLQPGRWGRAQAPRCWDPNLGPPQLISRVCTPGSTSLPSSVRHRRTLKLIRSWFESWTPELVTKTCCRTESREVGTESPAHWSPVQRFWPCGSGHGSVSQTRSLTRFEF